MMFSLLKFIERSLISHYHHYQQCLQLSPSPLGHKHNQYCCKESEPLQPPRLPFPSKPFVYCSSVLYHVSKLCMRECNLRWNGFHMHSNIVAHSNPRQFSGFLSLLVLSAPTEDLCMSIFFEN